MLGLQARASITNLVMGGAGTQGFMPVRPLTELHAPNPQKGFDSQVLEFIWEGTAGGHLLNGPGGRGGISAVLRLQSPGDI